MLDTTMPCDYTGPISHQALENKMCDRAHQTVVLDDAETAMLLVKDSDRIFYDLDSLVNILSATMVAQTLALAGSPEEVPNLPEPILNFLGGQEAMLEIIEENIVLLKAHGAFSDDALLADFFRE